MKVDIDGIIYTIKKDLPKFSKNFKYIKIGFYEESEIRDYSNKVRKIFSEKYGIWTKCYFTNTFLEGSIYWNEVNIEFDTHKNYSKVNNYTTLELWYNFVKSTFYKVKLEELNIELVYRNSEFKKFTKNYHKLVADWEIKFNQCNEVLKI